MFILSIVVYEQKHRNNTQVLLIFSNRNLYLPVRATSRETALSQTSEMGALRYTVVGYLNTCRPTCTSCLILIAFQIKSVLTKHVTVVLVS